MSDKRKSAGRCTCNTLRGCSFHIARGPERRVEQRRKRDDLRATMKRRADLLDGFIANPTPEVGNTLARATDYDDEATDRRISGSKEGQK